LNICRTILVLAILSLGLAGCPGTGPLGPAGSNWVKVGDAPWAGRHFLSGTVFNSRMWVIGGLSTNNDASVTQYYDDVWSTGNGSSWTRALDNAPFGPIRYGHRVLSFNGQMYLIGGASGSVKNDVWSSADGVTWTNILADSNATATHFSRRMDFGAEVFNGAMWVIGGYGSGAGNDVWNSTDGITWNQVLANGPASPTRFPGRWGHSTVVHNNLLWVIGGGTGPASGPTGAYTDVWNSPDGVTWTKVFDDPMDWPQYDDRFGAIYYHQTVANNGRIWLTCGWKFTMSLPIAQIGSTADGVDWTYYVNPIEPRFYHLSLPFQGSVWIMGGMSNIGGRTYFRDVWRSP